MEGVQPAFAASKLVPTVEQPVISHNSAPSNQNSDSMVNPNYGTIQSSNASSSHIVSEHSFRLDSISIIKHSAQVHDDPGTNSRGASFDQQIMNVGGDVDHCKGVIHVVQQRTAAAASCCWEAKHVQRDQQQLVVAVNYDGISSSSTAGHGMRTTYRRCCSKPWTLLGRNAAYWLLMAASSSALVLGLASATLLGRLYFVEGGSRRWLYTWIESTGWPILLPPLALCYGRYGMKPGPPLTPLLAVVFVVMGCLTAVTNLLYSWGLSYLPVSTNSLLCSSQLAFNAVFSYALVGQKITPYILNSIVTITLGTVLLAVSSGSDRPTGTTDREYVIGFIVTIVASALFALTLPLIELIYRKIVGKTSFVRVMEVQLGIEIAASLFSLIGMWVAGDFEAMKEEAMLFQAGHAAYINILFWSAVGWQLYLLGGVGIIFLASSLLSCSFMTAMIPVLPVLAVVFFHDSFSAVKGIAMVLSIWGFISFLYGGYLDHVREAKRLLSSAVPLNISGSQLL